MPNVVKGFKNINFMNRTQYDSSNISNDELWLVDVNTNTGFKGSVVSWGCPNYSAGVGFTFNASTSYKAPKDGFIFIYTGRAQDQYSNILINGTQVGYSIAYWGNIQYFFPVNKGDVVSTNHSTFSSARFYPLKGAN